MYIAIDTLGAKHGFKPFVNLAVQTLDPWSAQQIRGSHVLAMFNKSADLFAQSYRLCYTIAPWPARAVLAWKTRGLGQAK